MKSQQAMCKAMAGVTRSLQVMNRQMNMPAMQRMMMEYEKQSELMEFKQELMDEAMDDVFEAEGEEEKTEEMVNKILDEIGIGSMAGMASVPVGQKQAIAEDDDKELQARLDMLRGAK
jgi:charged multivesicular body protein 2A